MAREASVSSGDGFVTGGVTVAMSIVIGEQIEYPIIIDIFEVATSAFSYDAVVVEGLNFEGEEPSEIQPSGIATPLNVRVPTYRGEWASISVYETADVVKYNGKYWTLYDETSYTSAESPETDINWVSHDPRTVYLQLPKTLGLNWEVQPTPQWPTYGFLELAITEPMNPVFQRKWKPVRGFIQLNFSPTEVD